MVEQHEDDPGRDEVKTLKLKFAAALAGAAFALVGFTTTEARADGLIARSHDLKSQDVAQLRARIAEQRKQAPESFEAIRNLQGIRPEVYGQRRNPKPEVGRELQHLGASALLPMLEALVLDAPVYQSMSEPERQALIEGMLSAVGRLRDPRASAALRSSFELSQPSWASHGIAAALGKLCDAPSFGALAASLDVPARRDAAVAGLGECRTLEAAKRLSAELEARSTKATTPDETGRLASALGNLGSSWAWRALGADRSEEAREVRATISTALVKAFPRVSARPRDSVRAALSMVQAEGLREIVLANRPADAAAARELDEVVRIVERRSKR